MTNGKYELAALRNKIPGMVCIPGCTQCCGQTPWSEYEWRSLPVEDRKRYDRWSFKCSFCAGAGCSVYEHRPLICRMVGVIEGQPCPRGVPVTEILDVDRVNEITRAYLKLFFHGESASANREREES